MTENDAPEVTAEQVAQAWGCAPENPCYPTCIGQARRILDNWAGQSTTIRQSVTSVVPWIKGQDWDQRAV